MPEPPRLILASNRAPNLGLVKETVLPHVRLIIYKYDTCTLDDILTQVQQELGRIKVDSIAMLMHCSETEIFICFNGTKVLQGQSIKTDVSIRDFLRQLVSNTISPVAPGRRVDFLTVPIALQGEGNLLTRDIERLINMPIGMTKDLLGADVQVMRSRQDPSRRLTVGELYFDVARLGEQLQAVAGGSDHRLDGYEKIRTVGKGAFGTAILYRKVNDDTMVVIKEVNMVDLTAGERQMALNEAQVLSLLDHPNIISYLGSFERDGVLMIEMEYADGGTLAQMLQQRANRLSEREILLLFRQIVAAIRYMHDHNILHRDLKTANVFLTKDGNIKVGDFGISKMMTTRGQANTVLGTPYYISPEMCEGKQYDQKSDIWALGCILYEMACLQKTFEGSNLPALVNKIMKGQFQPIPGGYSPGFRQLVHDLLQRDPMFRPTAAEILDSRLPKLMDALVEEEGGEWFLEQDTIPNVHSGNGRSVLYDLKAFEYAVALTPLQLPPRSKIKEVAHSNTHVIVLTTELMVYTWGEGKKGQLGHGETEQWRQHPECVEVLKGKSINRIGAGDGYSVFVSDSGMLMTCGDGTFGCLGHGDWNNSVRPRLVEKLLSVDVAVVACGPHHIAVLSGDGDMYTWGRGDGGRLGLGNEEDCCIPMKVPLPSDCVFRTVRCGGDGTAVVTTEGAMLACGRNTYNKLGLGDRNLRLLSVNIKQGSDMDKALILTRVKGIGAKVADVSLGMYHSAVLTESGHVITFGRNIEGQLGRGHARNTGNSPAMVKSMADKVATMVKCGPTYTVVGTIENAVYFWGTRYGGSVSGQDMMSSLMISHAETGTWSQSRSKALDPSLQASKTGSQYTNLLNASTIHTNHLTEVVVEPQEMLALYASPSQIAKGETVNLGGLFPLRYSVLILVDTTVPLARLRPPGAPANDNSSDDESDDSSSSGEVPTKGPQQSSQDTEFDSIGPVPDWIREELAQSEAVWRNISNSQSFHH